MNIESPQQYGLIIHLTADPAVSIMNYTIEQAPVMYLYGLGMTLSL